MICFSDDVFGREIEFQRHKGRVLSRNWRKLQRAVLGHVVQGCNFPSVASSCDRRSARYQYNFIYYALFIETDAKLETSLAFSKVLNKFSLIHKLSTIIQLVD